VNVEEVGERTGMSDYMSFIKYRNRFVPAAEANEGSHQYLGKQGSRDCIPKSDPYRSHPRTNSGRTRDYTMGFPTATVGNVVKAVDDKERTLSLRSMLNQKL